MIRTDSPLISIPLCTYNGARYLREQLDSLLMQTYERVEIIAVDDASTDTTVAILREYASKHACMRVEVNPVNVGFKQNFADALSLCAGEYIAPCDQDDIWLPEKLAQMHARLNDKLLAYCDSELIDANGAALQRSMSDKWHMRSVADPAAFAMENNISGHAMLFKRELLQRALPIPAGFFHDWWLAAVAASVAGIVYCPQRLVRYRQHASNVTKKTAAIRQPAGFGMQKLQDTGDRIAQLARLAGPSQKLLTQLDLLWRARNRQWCSIALAWWFTRHYRLVFALKKRPPLARVSLPLKYLVGMRLKRLLSRHKYAARDLDEFRSTCD